ncbi:MAG TPA: selenium cofactor biosynthesis protein YqeC [Chloroflexota bacterium]|nr:selenium cofactor biosynthesis protein YqeC [Chloroflexota bacterium]
MERAKPHTLREALALGAARIVAFTGGGGKTTAMFRLAAELSAARVLVTTTTRIWAPRAEQAALDLAADLATACAQLRCADWAHGVRALGTAITPEGKLQGVPPAWIAALAAEADYVLVEADGAAGKPLTAPRAYEPVIPPATELLVPVAGVEAVGAPLDAAHVHRVPEIAALTGVPIGAPLAAPHVATVMLSAQGNVKGAPAGARIVPLVNKVDTPAAEAVARTLAAALLAAGVERVVLARLASADPVVAVVEHAPRVQAASRR